MERWFVGGSFQLILDMEKYRVASLPYDLADRCAKASLRVSKI